MISWTNALVTGFDEIDLQHKTLIKLINGLEVTVQRGETADHAHVGEMLRFLEGYARTHFAREERCMTETHCPAAQTNQRAHAQFLQDYQQLKQRFDEQQAPDTLLMEIYTMASRWITNHICRVDVRLRDCVPARKSVASRT